MDTGKIHGIIRRNNLKNARFSSYFTGFFSIWNAFIIPIALGVGISYLFQFTGKLNELPNYFFIIYILLFIFQAVISVGYIFLDKREDTSTHLEEVVLKYNVLTKDYADLTKRSLDHSEIHQTQKAAIHFTTLLIMNKLNEMAKKVDSKALTQEDVANDTVIFFETVLSFLSAKREVLFGYKSESKFNIAFYLFDPSTNMLNVRARICDDRLTKRNRSWKSGFGHVGLTHLHAEMKICPDITKSSELNSDDENDNINYRSFMSVPVLTPDTTMSESCLGVLVLTSAHTNQFKIERDRDFLLTFSYLLTIYLDSMFKIYINDAIEPSDGSVETSNS